MDKAALLRAIVGKLEAELTLLVAAANESKAEATDAESKQEGKYDMRGQSAAYLAAGQARLAAELGETIAAYRALPADPFPPGSAAGIGAVVAVETGKRRAHYLLGPSHGGIDVEIGGISVTAVTAGSPVGRALFGRRAGERIRLPGQREESAIENVE